MAHLQTRRCICGWIPCFNCAWFCAPFMRGCRACERCCSGFFDPGEYPHRYFRNFLNVTRAHFAPAAALTCICTKPDHADNLSALCMAPIWDCIVSSLDRDGEFGTLAQGPTTSARFLARSSVHQSFVTCGGPIAIPKFPSTRPTTAPGEPTRCRWVCLTFCIGPYLRWRKFRKGCHEVALG